MYRADVAKANEVSFITGKNMLQVSVCNENINQQGFHMAATISFNSLLNSLENRGLDMNQVYSITCSNMTLTVCNNATEYIIMKHNSYNVDDLIGEFSIANHFITVKKANSKAKQVSFLKVPDFILDTELIHFASKFGKVVNIDGMIYDKLLVLDLQGRLSTLVRGDWMLNWRTM